MILLLSGAALGVLALRAWRKQRLADRDMAARFVHRTPELHMQIVNAHRAEHYRIVNGAWRVNFNQVHTPLVRRTAAELLTPYEYKG
jgi:hypothetical protein